jgi:hypothetical protein
VDQVLLRLRSRLAPAVVVAFGILLLADGLLSYTRATEPQPEVLAVPTYAPLPSLGDVSLASGAGLPTFYPDRVVTRVAIARLGIDIPVVLQSGEYGDAYPLCDVAMYLPYMGQPGWGRATYIYAHAQPKMFGPMEVQSRINDGAAMIGMIVQVWTSDDWLFLYRIVEVRRHTRDVNDAVNATTEQLWLQTSETPRGVLTKLQVVADFVSAEPADPVAAHPQAHPRICNYH